MEDKNKKEQKEFIDPVTTSVVTTVGGFLAFETFKAMFGAIVGFFTLKWFKKWWEGRKKEENNDID